jgi:hypothetical protein
MSSPVETDAKEDIKSLGTSVQSRQGSPVVEALVLESVPSHLAKDVEELKSEYEELKKDVQGLKGRDVVHERVCICLTLLRTQECISHTHFTR